MATTVFALLHVTINLCVWFSHNSPTGEVYAISSAACADNKCPVASTNADKIENYVVKKLKEISSEEETFRRTVEHVNLDLETATSPYQKELDETNSRIREIERGIENFLDAVGKTGSKVTSLLEKKIERLRDDLERLKKRKDELAVLIASSPTKISAQIVLDALKDFSGLYDELRPTERAEYLQRIIRDIVVTDDKVTINIYRLFNPPSNGSKNHDKWWAVKESNLQPSD